MKYYFDYLKQNKLNVIYMEFDKIDKNWYSNLKYNIINCYEPFDYVLEQKIKHIHFIKNPNFLLDDEIISNKKPISFLNFYKKQRIRLNILIKDNKPIQGVWSFDKQNRKKIPKNISLPPNPKIINNSYIEEAKKYILQKFSNNYGSLDYFIYPITHKDCKLWLKNFLNHLLNDFGPYEDAIIENQYFLWHSVLSPMMNIGLLTDQYIIGEVLKYENKVRIESLEGFIRQIIGWRNYILTYYICFGNQIRNSNYLQMKNKINSSLYKKLWTGTVGIDPIDNVINGIIKYSYAHHIQRLMVLGNFLLLLQLHPNDVYKMFMEWTIDSYDWVMLPNVYSMSQYADGGFMMTRPYFSSSSYILKMSNFKKGKWCDIWNNLYYNFLINYKEILNKNYSTATMIHHLDKKTSDQKQEIIKKSSQFIQSL
jgi:deoxyribodipyrimidine photolyase-related protein